ncbi:MAG: carboxypeptidase-like regulatory domain-containing protein, partial [Cytophagaceae bacterium]|nr:carboxypeptidase-like regulatory domain-containing protein [Cytophagaceae bacterium]
MDIYKTFQPKYLKRGLLLIALLMCHIWAAAQPTGTIRGAVTDAASGGALPYVNVVVMNTAPPAG